MSYHFKDRIQLTDVVLSGGLRPTETEVVVMELWADIRTLQGREIATIVTEGANLAISRFIVRYTPGIKPHYKVKYKDQDYKIISITNDDEQNRTITIVGEAILM